MKTEEVTYSLDNLLYFFVQVEMLKRQKDEVMIFHFGKILLLCVFTLYFQTLLQCLIIIACF
jgi:hypothetical protein